MAFSDPKPAETFSNNNRKRPQLYPKVDGEQGEGSPDQKKAKLNETWANLDLVLSLQSKDLNTQRKIEIAFDFITSEVNFSVQGPKPVSISRLVSSLSDWIQSVLISSDHNKKSSELFDPSSDYRCWVILKLCLKNSSISVSPNLLRPITRVLKNKLLVLSNDYSLPGQESVRFFEIINEYFALLLPSKARAFYNAGVELWVSCVVEIVDVVRRILANDECGFSTAEVLLRLSGLLLEHFASFLRFHPNPRNIFRIFVDRLLEPLLELVVLLHLQTKNGKFGQVGSLSRLVEDVLSNGLFHPVHIGGFFLLKGLNAKQDARESKVINESYHRHFFKKLEKIIAQNKAMALSGFGYLFRLFISSAKTRKGASLASKGERALGKSSEVSEEAQETSKPLFEVFVQFMQPLLLECRRCAEKEFSELGKVSENRLVDAHCMLKSANETLASFIEEKIYVRTEDTSEGAHYNFLKEVYDAINSISGKMYLVWLSALHMDDARVKKMLPLIAGEVVAAMGYFLEIEYKIVEDDLVKLWLMMFSYLAVHMSLEDTEPYSFLTSEVLNLGCRLIDVYSELRQVGNPLFALCKAVRLLKNAGDAGAVGSSMFVSSPALSSHIYLKSVGTLLCSQELRLAIFNAIKSIPEGQASGCIQQLKIDITYSLEWIRLSFLRADGKNSNETDNQNVSMADLDMQLELLGRLLSEIYTIMLDSLTVSATNSIFIGNSIKNLMKTIRPSFSNLVQSQSGSIDEFIFSLTGRRLYNQEMSESDSRIWSAPLSISWAFVFLFRMYISCRSLYRQSISLMPPDSSRKASESMGNFFTVACGVDWEGNPESMDEGYFSWIVKPSTSLPDVIKFLSEDFLSSSSAGCASLVYVIHVMALQRLGDLNRLIKAFEFLQKRDIHKSSNQWKRLVTVSRQEAAELTNFMTGHLKLLDYTGLYISGQNDETGEAKLAYDDDAWDLGVCSLNEKSLRIAIWRLLCQNIDVWCAHAASKYLRKFLSCLFLHSIPGGNTSRDIRNQSTMEPFCRKVTMHHISFEFLTDIVSYEQTILYKHFTSRFCRVLKKSLSSILSHACASNIDLGFLPDWSEFLKILEKGPLVNMDDRIALPDLSSLSGSDSVLPKMQYLEHNDRQSCSSFSMELRTCESLLNLLYKMPKVHVTAKSFSVYATYVLNLEKLVVSNLLDNRSESFIYNPYELLSLFISCRRVMKYLIVASLEENSGARDSSSLYAVFDCSSSILWLLKSVSEVVGLPHVFFGEKYSSQVQDMIFSLIDHTSYIFLAISEGQMNGIITFLLTDEKLHTEQPVDKDPSKQHTFVEADQHSNSSEYFEAGKYVELMAEKLEEQTRNLLVSLKSSLHAIKLESRIRVLSCNKLSSMVSCFHGFLWGLISALGGMYKDCSAGNPQSSRLMRWCLSKLSKCIAVFEEMVYLCLNILIVDDSKGTEVLCTVHNPQELYNCGVLSSLDVLPDSAYKFSCSEFEHSSENHPRTEKQGIRADSLTCNHDDNGKNPSGCDYTKSSSLKKQKLSSLHVDCVANVFNAVHKIDFSKLQNLKGSLLQSLLKGEDPQIAFTLRQLFTASAAILKLKSMLYFSRALGSEIHCSQLALNSMGVLLGTSQLVLREMAEMVGRPDPFSFVWLDGALTFLEVVGSIFSFTDPNLSKDVYAQLIDTHLRAIGKCISLQGKAATLSSHETGSNTKMLQSQNGSSGNGMQLLDHGRYSINALKARLRMSFKNFIRRPPKLHLKTALKSLERALVGVQQGCNVVYEINTGNVDGGKVSSIVAAGIDCLELVLESLSGHKRVLDKNILSLISAVFNIVLHLQNPTIFYLEKLPHDECEVKPDAGSVILMCVEILTKVAGNHSFPMDPCHVSQCLQIPLALFKGFYQLRDSRFLYESSTFSDNQKARPSRAMHKYIVDRQFSVELYASCCRLLCTTLKHRKHDSERCIALLEESVTTLLNCLEIVDADIVRGKGRFAWDVEGAIKCASFLRRIYEEVRHQKDVLGKYSSYFLSNYIYTYSGYGPLKTGIKREIDEALRPGVYSLIDICTEADCQQLHTLLGEGPCRSTLKTLLHDYKLNFQYEGKI